MELTTWGLFALASLTATLAPGPNTLLVMTHAVRFGLRASLLTITANLSSQFVFMLLVVYGFGAFLAHSPTLYLVLKTAGAAYLIWLGIRMFMTAGAPLAAGDDGRPMHPSATRRFTEAVLVSCSNPKTMLFLSALLPQFLDPAAPLATQFVVMFLTNAGIILTVHMSYAGAALSLKRRVVSPTLKRRVGRLTGATFASLGVGLLASRSPA